MTHYAQRHLSRFYTGSRPLPKFWVTRLEPGRYMLIGPGGYEAQLWRSDSGAWKTSATSDQIFRTKKDAVRYLWTENDQDNQQMSV